MAQHKHLRGQRAQAVFIDDPVVETPAHCIELGLTRDDDLLWVGQCASCQAVHIRHRPRLVDHGEEDRRFYSMVEDYGGREHRYIRNSMLGTRMARECAQPTGEDVPDPYAQHYRTRRDTVPCSGYVFEVPGQAAILSAMVLGGPEAAIAMCMDPDRARSTGELICREDAARRTRR